MYRFATGHLLKCLSLQKVNREVMEITVGNDNSNGEIVLYQPDKSIRLEVRIADDTVWLSQAQMAELFKTTPQNITIHIKNIYREFELEKEATCKDYLQVQREGKRVIRRAQKFYNLDVIISVGYRVKSIYGTRFRQWANAILKEYLLKGYSINNRIEHLEQRVYKTEEKIDFFIKTSLPPKQGIFYDGQVFDAYSFVSGLIRKAKKSIVLIDNYIDDTVLTLLDKRESDVSAIIYTRSICQQLQLDIVRHNCQYPPIDVKVFDRSHDRFLLIDEEVYHIGASLKDLGKKWFGFTLMRFVSAEEIVDRIS